MPIAVKRLVPPLADDSPVCVERTAWVPVSADPLAA